MEQQIDTRNAINLGTALDVIRAYLDVTSDRESPEFVAALCVLERLTGQNEPALA